MHATDSCESKYQYLVNKYEKVGSKHYDDHKAFTDYSNDKQAVYQNIDEYNRKVLSIFDVMIADVINIKKLNPVVAELFIRGRKLNFPIVLITLSYFKIPRDVKQNATQFFIMKIPNKRGLQRIALNYLLHIDFKNFIEIYKKCTYSKCTYPYSFLVHDTTLLSDTSLRFKKIFKIKYIIHNDH